MGTWEIKHSQGRLDMTANIYVQLTLLCVTCISRVFIGELHIPAHGECCQFKVAVTRTVVCP